MPLVAFSLQLCQLEPSSDQELGHQEQHQSIAWLVLKGAHKWLVLKRPVRRAVGQYGEPAHEQPKRVLRAKLSNNQELPVRSGACGR
jgi:hypothetical protein